MPQTTAPVSLSRFVKSLVFALSCIPFGAPLTMMACQRCHSQQQPQPPQPQPVKVPPSACIPCQQTPAPADGGGYLNGCLPTLCAKTDGGALCCTVTPASDGYHYTTPDGGAATID